VTLVTNANRSSSSSVKWAQAVADMGGMIISDDEARNVTQDLKSGRRSDGTGLPDVSPEFLERVRLAVMSAPETREDRVQEARELLGNGGFDSYAVAQKIISRMVCDTVR
jgi:hypothetical protein